MASPLKPPRLPLAVLAMRKRWIFLALAAVLLVLAWPPEYFRVRRLEAEMRYRIHLDALAWQEMHHEMSGGQ